MHLLRTIRDILSGRLERRLDELQARMIFERDRLHAYDLKELSEKLTSDEFLERFMDRIGLKDKMFSRLGKLSIEIEGIEQQLLATQARFVGLQAQYFLINFLADKSKTGKFFVPAYLHKRENSSQEEALELVAKMDRFMQQYSFARVSEPLVMNGSISLSAIYELLAETTKPLIKTLLNRMSNDVKKAIGEIATGSSASERDMEKAKFIIEIASALGEDGEAFLSHLYIKKQKRSDGRVKTLIVEVPDASLSHMSYLGQKTYSEKL